MIRLDPDTFHDHAARGPVLDVREPGSFAAGHLRGSGHIPLGDLKARRSELPPRHATLVVVAESGAEAAAAAEAIEALGYEGVSWLDAPIRDLEVADITPPTRLWRPAPFLEEVLPELPRGAALELAAGAGREAVFLALHGFEVEAWDHDRGALERASALAERHGVAIETRVRNLERRDPGIPESRFALVTVFRFLHRPLFPHLERALQPGGRLVIETYRRGQERFGRPKHPRFLLDPGELRRAFPTLEVLRYEEIDLPEGPVTARLLARRPGPVRSASPSDP